jgi:hypothetical protein
MAGCGSNEASIHDPVVQQTVAKEAGVPLQQVQDAVALQVAYEDAVKAQAEQGTIVGSIKSMFRSTEAFAVAATSNSDAERTDDRNWKSENDKADDDYRKVRSNAKTQTEKDKADADYKKVKADIDSNHPDAKKRYTSNNSTVIPVAVIPPVDIPVAPEIITPPAPVPVPVTNYSIVATVPLIKGKDTNIQLLMSSAVGTAPFVWTGPVPEGLTLSPSGLLTGKPTKSLVLANVLKVTDATNVVYSKALITICAINQPLAVATLPPMAKGVATTVTLAPEFSTGPYVYSGVGPAGTKVGPTNIVVGTPVLVGTYSAILTTKDAAGDIAMRITPATVTQ